MESPIHLKDLTRDRWIRSGIGSSSAWPGNSVEHYLGELLIWAGVLEIYDAFRRSDAAGRRSAWLGGMLSLLMGALLVNALLLRPAALYLFVIALFGIDALRNLRGFMRGASGFHRWANLAAFIGNLALVGTLYFLQSEGQVFMLSLAVGLRMAGISINVLFARTGRMEEVDEDVAEKIGMKDEPAVKAIAEKIRLEEENGATHDRRWIVVFVILLFAIHHGRMGLDRTMLGILSPLVATIGDLVVALLVTYLFLAPIRMLMLKLMRQRAQRLWRWIGKVEEKDRKWYSLRNLAAAWLSQRMRAEVRFIKVGYSLPTAIRSGLKIGLPWAALLVAVMPVLGMSWYFDTENWASGIWDKWAASRADVWRMAMIKSSGEDLSENSFRLRPEGVTDTASFSFVVIGDTGEGDASQLVLKDQLIEVSDQPDVKFVLISSDVVYPNGTLRDYEKKFWLPFKGVKKPVYAIPGNHDYYDALDGFAATFFDEASARKAMRARAAADLKLTTSSESLIDESIRISERWRKEYNVSTGHQQVPFFQVSTQDFVLITIETGVERQIDSLQRRWLVNVLEASKGKFVMVLLGHPFYAIGEYQGKMNPKFESIHALLRRYKVPLAIAGDTHDLEYYMEPNEGFVMHHFVNGGGGAYLSIGAAMGDTTNFPTRDFAFYPRRKPLEEKIEANTKWYKRPAWWWTTALDGWPFSAEWLSAMFDYNVAPFFRLAFPKEDHPDTLQQQWKIEMEGHDKYGWGSS